jgi:Flp pilus assembly pilin Flp
MGRVRRDPEKVAFFLQYLSFSADGVEFGHSKPGIRRSAAEDVLANPNSKPEGRTAMHALRTLMVKLVKDESGVETMEYALILGLIVVAVIGAVSAVGTGILHQWKSVSKSAI